MRVIPGPLLEGYIDKSITEWRTRIDEIRSLRGDTIFPNMESTDELKALSYIDALQDIRKEFLGGKLPEDV